MKEKAEKKKEGRSSDWVENSKTVGDHPVCATTRCPIRNGLSVNPTVQYLHTTCSLPANEAALILVRFYMSPPADPGRTLRKTAYVSEPIAA